MKPSVLFGGLLATIGLAMLVSGLIRTGAALDQCRIDLAAEREANGVWINPFAHEPMDDCWTDTSEPMWRIVCDGNPPNDGRSFRWARLHGENAESAGEGR